MMTTKRNVQLDQKIARLDVERKVDIAIRKILREGGLQATKESSRTLFEELGLEAKVALQENHILTCADECVVDEVDGELAPILKSVCDVRNSHHRKFDYGTFGYRLVLWRVQSKTWANLPQWFFDDTQEAMSV